MIQGLLRQIGGDTREDIHNLYSPLSKVFEWFDNNDEKMKFFYKKGMDGIDILLEGYDTHSIIYPTLQHYKKIFSNALQGTTMVIEKNGPESPLLNYLKDFWDDTELDIIHKKLQYIDMTNDNKSKMIYLSTIEEILTMKENNITEYIKKYSTSYH